MTFEQRFERDLPLILDDIATGTYPDYIDGVLTATATRRQRPTWTFPERWLPVELVTTRVPSNRLAMRQLGVLALIAILIGAALAVYIGTHQQRIPPPFGLAANGDLILSVGGDVVRLDPVSGQSTEIVSAPDFDSMAKISPDGQRVAFVRRATEQDTTASVVVAAVDGSGARVLTAEPVARGFDMIAWAPDSRSLLVDTSMSQEIWRYDAVGSAPPQLVISGADAYASPFRPPDGTAILIYRNHGMPQLSILDLETSKETVLAEARTDQDFDDVRWSPDGSRVAYHAAPEGDLGSQRLFVVSAAGGEPRQITDAPGVWWDIDETWSPDGRAIAFDRYENVGSEWLVRPLAIVDVASSAVREIGPIAHDARAQLGAPTDAAASAGEGMWFEWSPDGKYLLAVPTEAPAHPVLIDVATGDWRNLEPLIAPDFVDQAWQRLAE